MTDCARKIIEASKGTLSEAEANDLISRLAQRAQHRVGARGMTLENAAAEVAGEMERTEILKSEISKRNAVLTVKTFHSAFERVQDASKKTGKTLGASFADFLKLADEMGRAIGQRATARFYGELERAGVIKAYFKGGDELSLDVERELWSLSAGEGRATQNETAFKIASIQRPIRMEMTAMANRFGAYIPEVPGYTIQQTHDGFKLWKAGKSGGVLGLFAKESMDKSYQAWRGSMNDLHIDWDRTFEGSTPAQREKFLKDFHSNIYRKVYGGPLDATDLEAFKPGGSLAGKLSSQRVLWFADAESQWKYRKMWGTDDFNRAMVGELLNRGHSIGLMQVAGPNPEQNLRSVVEALRKSTESRDDGRLQAESLSGAQVTGSIDLVMGRDKISTRPTLQKFTDNLVAMTMMSKAGGTMLASFPDMASFHTVMVHDGASATEALAAPLLSFKPGSKEGNELAEAIGFYSHSYSGELASAWGSGVHGSKSLRRGVELTFKWGGQNLWTDIHDRNAANQFARLLGKDAGIAFDALPIERQSLLEKFNISSAEWDAYRSTAYLVDGQWKVISPDRVHSIPDAAIDAILAGEAEAATPLNRLRKRDLMDAKLTAYLHDRVDEAIPKPDFHTRRLMTLNAMPRGSGAREIAVLASVFKGFPLAVALQAKGRFGERAGMFSAWNATMHTAMLVAEAGALGYLSLTAKDFLAGKTPRRLVEDGKVNHSVWMAALVKGGGAGIYGDFLFSEYDRRYRTFLGAMAGPVLGQLDPLAAMLTKARGAATGEASGESLGYDAFQFTQNNLPLVNMFYIKPVMDHLIFWHLREGLSPGIFRRSEKMAQEKNHQDYWIEPMNR